MNKTSMSKVAADAKSGSRSKPAGGGKMEMGSISKAVGMLNKLKKGEPHCG